MQGYLPDLVSSLGISTRNQSYPVEAHPDRIIHQMKTKQFAEGNKNSWSRETTQHVSGFAQFENIINIRKCIYYFRLIYFNNYLSK